MNPTQHKDYLASVAESLKLEETIWVDICIPMHQALEQGVELFKDRHRSQMDVIDILDEGILRIAPKNYNHVGWLVTVTYKVTDYEKMCRR